MPLMSITLSKVSLSDLNLIRIKPRIFRKVSTKKFVSIFKEATENGKEDNYEKTDAAYLRQSPCLTEYLEQYVITNKDQIFEEKEDIF